MIELRAGQVESFWKRAIPDSKTGCLIWTGAHVPKGYGVVTMNGPQLERMTNMAHRWAWILTHGPLAQGLEIDHLCRNRLCVNPEHMEPVTHAENMRRGQMVRGKKHHHGRKTHCPRGHPLSGSNLRTWTDKRGYTRRYCRECGRQTARAWRENVLIGRL